MTTEIEKGVRPKMVKVRYTIYGSSNVADKKKGSETVFPSLKAQVPER